MFQDITAQTAGRARRRAERGAAAAADRQRHRLRHLHDDSRRARSTRGTPARSGCSGTPATRSSAATFDVLFTPEDRASGAPAARARTCAARRPGARRALSRPQRRHAVLRQRRDHASRRGRRVSGSPRSPAISRPSGSAADDAAPGARRPRLARRRADARARDRPSSEQQLAQVHVVNLLRKVVTAQEDERGRIARNLHDQLGQRLTALRLSLERVQERLGTNNGRADEDVERALESDAHDRRRRRLPVLGAAAGGARSSRARRRPAALRARMVGSLRHRSRSARATRSRPAADATKREVALYRIAQEALTNIAKHAHASRVDVMLESRDDSVVLVVEDDGVGFDRVGRHGPRARRRPARHARARGADWRRRSRSNRSPGKARRFSSAIPAKNSAAGRAMNPIRVLLVEDHETVREGLRLLLDSQSDMEVVAEACRRPRRGGVQRALPARTSSSWTCRCRR